MTTRQGQSSVLTISDVDGLDTITVVTVDTGPGAGRILVECYGEAWASYFNATGKATVADFVASMGHPDYLVSKLWPPRERRTKHREHYLASIVAVVLRAMKEPTETTQ